VCKVFQRNGLSLDLSAPDSTCADWKPHRRGRGGVLRVKRSSLLKFEYSGWKAAGCQ
jgi:hypothetical protein